MFDLHNKITRRPLRLARRQRQQPLFEPMEQRRMMSGTYYVTTTGDSGAGTLRDAITQVDKGLDNTIDFSISKSDAGFSAATGTWTINLKSTLPDITQSVLVNSSSVSQSSTAPSVTLNGSGLAIDAANVTVRGLALSTVRINGENGANAGNDNLYYDALGVVSLLNSATHDSVLVNSFNSGGSVTLDATSGSDTVASNQFANDSSGLRIQVASSGNVIQGNTITEDPRWSFCNAIEIDGNNNTIQGNTFSYVGGTGLVISGSGNTVESNRFLSDGTAIQLTATASGNLIGGYDNAAEGNLIQVGGDGIQAASGSFGNAFVGNSTLYTNAQRNLGIDLGGNANDGIAPPTITTSSSTLTNTTVTGTVHSFAGSTVRVELFASQSHNGGGGETYLGSVTVTTNAAGNATFSDTIVGRFGGEAISATQTVGHVVISHVGKFPLISYENETSEYSSPFTDTGLAPLQSLPRLA